MRYIFLSIFLFSGYLGKAQTSLNEYKYIVVPKRLSDFKKDNQHQTSTVIKHLFTKKGFTTAWDDNMPEDLSNSRCKGLYVDLRDKSSMFSTKTTIVLKDCNNQVVFSSVEGKSKEKEFKKSYADAIEKAMTSFDGLNYKYEGGDDSNEPITVSFKNDVKNLEEEKTTAKAAKNQTEVVEIQEATTERQTYKSKEPKESTFKKAEKKSSAEQKTALEEEGFKTVEPVSADIKKPEVEQAISKVLTTESNILYAQGITNGYQLVDSSPKIVMKILKTSKPDYYLAEGDWGAGIVFKQDDHWFFEHYIGSKLTTEELNIKF